MRANDRQRYLEAEREGRKCKRDPAHFARYLKIRRPGRGRIPFQPYPSQREVLEAYQKHRHNFILKARQTGFTTVTMLYVLWYAMFHPDVYILILSKREEDAVKNLKMAIDAYKRLPKWLKLWAGDGKREARTNNAVTQMTFLNGSVIDSLPATGDTGRGESADLVVLDEWAFYPDPDNTWAAIEPVVDVGGRLIIISTAKGFDNIFHRQWVKAASGMSYFNPIFYGWDAAPFRDENWHAQKQESLEPWVLAQEYPSTPEEAFVQSARTYFDVDIIRGWEPRKFAARYEIESDGSWKDKRDGRLRVWRVPDRSDTYVIGGDTAEGLPHGDYSSAHVLSVTTGEVVATWHGRIDPDLFGKQVLYHLAATYNWALLGVERNGSGMTTLSALNNAEYPNLYFTTMFDRNQDITTKKFGWTTSKVTRPLMLDELNEAIREDALSVWCEGTRQELLTFVRDDNGKGRGSPHDDRVISLAIAVQMLKFAHHPDYVTPIHDEGTLGWWDRMAEAPSNGAEMQEIVGNERVRSQFAS